MISQPSTDHPVGTGPGFWIVQRVVQIAHVAKQSPLVIVDKHIPLQPTEQIPRHRPVRVLKQRQRQVIISAAGGTDNHGLLPVIKRQSVVAW